MNGGVENGFPLPLGNEVYKRHYVEILKALNRWQSPALKMLYQYVDHSNSALGRLRKHRDSIYDKDMQHDATAKTSNNTQTP